MVLQHFEKRFFSTKFRYPTQRGSSDASANVKHSKQPETTRNPSTIDHSRCDWLVSAVSAFMKLCYQNWKELIVL